MTNPSAVSFTADLYFEAGCKQFMRGKDDAIALTLIKIFAGNMSRMCHGCGFQYEKCDAYHKLSKAIGQPGGLPPPQETVREEAKRLGVSIGEVRRRRTEERVSGG